MRLKRCFDLVCSLLGLLLLAPLLAAIGVWIAVDSPGGVLFRQPRIGRGGVPFTILKFRTMHAAPAGPLLTVGADARITRAGRWLRRSKLDELPQLWNVVRGEMSLVGPRPEVARYVACYPATARRIVLSVPPGLTDWAALRYRDESATLAAAPDPERAYIDTILPIKLDYYQRYVRERSFWMDLRILFRTVWVLLARS